MIRNPAMALTLAAVAFCCERGGGVGEPSDTVLPRPSSRLAVLERSRSNAVPRRVRKPGLERG
jgi:hypothetical protein